MPNVAWAQGSDRSAPLGGRSALMGDTGVALARDGAAPFLNPATIVRIRDQDLAFSTHLYTFEITHFSNLHRPGPVDSRFGSVALDQTGVTTSRVAPLPSSICFFFTLSGLLAPKGQNRLDDVPIEGGRQQLAFCIGTVEQEDVRMPALRSQGSVVGGKTAQTESISEQWNRTHIGPSYSLQIDRRWAIGASLHVAYSTASFVNEASTISAADDASPVQSSLGMSGSGRSYELTAIFGTTVLVGKTLVGASIQIPSLHLYGQYDTSLHTSYAATGRSDAAIAVGSGSFRAPPPVRIALGAGRTWGPLTVEADTFLTFHVGEAITSSLDIDDTQVAGGKVVPIASHSTYTQPSRPALNLGLGAEYVLSEGFSVVAGASTAFTTYPKLVPAPAPSLANLTQSRKSEVKLSIGIGSYGSAGNLMLGTQLGFGWGQAIAADPYLAPNDWSVVSTQSYSALLIFAGSTNLRAIKRTVDKVEDAVKNGIKTPPPSNATTPTNPPAAANAATQKEPAPPVDTHIPVKPEPPSDTPPAGAPTAPANPNTPNPNTPNSNTPNSNIPDSGAAAPNTPNPAPANRAVPPNPAP